MNLLFGFFSIIIGRWLLGGIGSFVRKIFQSKKDGSSKPTGDSLDFEGTYDRVIGIIVIFIINLSSINKIGTKR
ncbi:hypothetical protein ACVWYN_002439 [Pedobacter sp. UYP24]